MCEHNLVDSQQRSFSHCYSCTTQPGTCTPERDPMLADNWFGHNWIIDDINIFDVETYEICLEKYHKQ